MGWRLSCLCKSVLLKEASTGRSACATQFWRGDYGCSFVRRMDQQHEPERRNSRRRPSLPGDRRRAPALDCSVWRNAAGYGLAAPGLGDAEPQSFRCDRATAALEVAWPCCRGGERLPADVGGTGPAVSESFLLAKNGAFRSSRSSCGGFSSRSLSGSGKTRFRYHRASETGGCAFASLVGGIGRCWPLHRV